MPGEQTVSTLKGVFLGRVLSNEPICREHFRLIMEVPGFPSAAPGQFVQMLCNEPSESGWTGGAFVRRPFSIGGLQTGPDGTRVQIMHRAIGIGTKWLARLRAGDGISVLGPLGQPFRMPPSSSSPCLLVGGGIGLPPLIWLAEALRKRNQPVIAFGGSRSADLLPLTRRKSVACSPHDPSLFCEEFARFGVEALVATDDGSLGAQGLLPEVFDRWLDRHSEMAASATVYTCGPQRMMQAVAEVCRRREMACQVCLERMMACGMGTCQSCVVPTRDAQAAEGWRYKLCCTDGPVFDAKDVIWVS